MTGGVEIGVADVSKSEVATKFASSAITRKRRCRLIKRTEVRLMCIGSEDAAWCIRDLGAVFGPGPGGDGA